MERLAKEVKYVDDMYSDERRTIIKHQNDLINKQFELLKLLQENEKNMKDIVTSTFYDQERIIKSHEEQDVSFKSDIQNLKKWCNHNNSNFIGRVDNSGTCYTNPDNMHFSNSIRGEFLVVKLGDDPNIQVLVFDENNNVINRDNFQEFFVGKFMENKFTNPVDMIEKVKEIETDVTCIDIYRFGLFSPDGTKSFFTIAFAYRFNNFEDEHKCSSYCGDDCSDQYSLEFDGEYFSSGMCSHVWQWIKEIPNND
jgi:hypothetical protein